MGQLADALDDSTTVPCLRRVSQLAYGGGVPGAEEGETMLSFAEEAAAAAGGEGDDEDWVATHTSGKGALVVRLLEVYRDI